MLNPTTTIAWSLLTVPDELQEPLAEIHPFVWMLTVIRWFQWQTELAKQEANGVKTCPLMILEPVRFPVDVCACSIPATRKGFLVRHPNVSCSHGKRCLPVLSCPSKAQEEMTAPAPRATRPRGSWTAAFRTTSL